ncbi:ethanolamine ammonia-lyase reactivating factor EutA [Novisyntrophococcus fermenticellae]|uniref:ethanolamine ammonia-lyase reactivating factor EutA n=1 Tax=Novisyntrophococcus fermenticellae TaxID=2068655 RepID=UPI001E5B3D90|nr:ethanolamine ammonia-lyase reactivating factor EutA [Novisyntrophococcus fermenticellae]
MKEELLSVGIDLGTSTTQLVFSKLSVENMASGYTVPRMAITKKEIRYKSEIYFTPLIDQTKIDFEKVSRIVEKEYQKAGVRKEEIDTGAVIITGETARKENSREVINALSGFAGDFVVATAGPDLESVIAGKGAGTDLYSKEHHLGAVNVDIGGGTSNLAVFQRGETVDTGCLDIGGRLIKMDSSHKITYIAPKLLRIIEQENLKLAVGAYMDIQSLKPLLRIMVEVLEQSVGLRRDSPYYERMITNHGIGHEEVISCISFSGGVADAIYHPEKFQEPFQFGDIGILLGKEIRESKAFQKLQLIESAETIRATVVGAGSHTTEISGSTITYTSEAFPIKNLPVLKVSKAEEEPGKLGAAIHKKLEWFSLEGRLQKVAVALEGLPSPSFQKVQEYARELLEGMEPLMEAGLPLIVVVEEDMAKVLGQSMYHLLNWEKEVICLDGIHLAEGEYIDIGRPIAEGYVLPVVVKTLVFQENRVEREKL